MSSVTFWAYATECFGRIVPKPRDSEQNNAITGKHKQLPQLYLQICNSYSTALL